MSSPHSEALLQKVRNLPEQPGVYRFLNKRGKIIYIGKAKSLRKRVASYFLQGRGHSYRIRRMVELIDSLEYTVTHSEVEALLLENNLIKNHQPKYNILLKDGKSYPYICISNERFPRVFVSRQRQQDGSLYFGPYTHGGAMNAILDLIRGFIKLRNCTYTLSEANISAGKFRLCMEYQIGNCGGPCTGLVSEAAYTEGIEQVKHILRGNLAPVENRLRQLMQDAAGRYEFEKAAWYKKKLEQVRAYRVKNTVVSGKDADLEVLTVLAEEELAIVNHFKVHHGAIVQTHAYELKRSHQEEAHEILAAALERLAQETEVLFPDIVVNVEMPEMAEWEAFRFSIPQRGDRQRLIELSVKNCRTLLDEKLYEQNFRQRKTPQEAMMEALQQALHLKSLPDHIECVDNSNFQGAEAVSALVVFKQGKPSKKDYRHYNVRTVEGPDDFATMREVVERRFRRLLEEGQELPKLFVVDGGKGQLSSAVEAMKKTGVYGKVPVIGIAKRLEELYVPEDPHPLHLDKKSPALRLIQQMRDEAHRFGITHHRNRRSKAPNQRTGLTALPGIGEESARKILASFKSLKKLKEATPEQRIAALGKSKAAIIQQAIESGKI